VAQKKRRGGKVTRQKAARLVIDLAMTVLLLLALGYRITGDIAHEWLGVSLCVMFIAHNIVNRKWWRNIFKVKYNTRRAVMFVINVLLALVMAAVIITGLLHSRTVLAFLHLPGGMALRQIHTTAAYWGLILIAVHAGLHLRPPKNFKHKRHEPAGNFASLRCAIHKPLSSIFIRSCGWCGSWLIIAFGVWSFIDRDMFAKLFLGFSFDYWNEERPVALFFAETLGIMAVFAFAVHYAMKLAGGKGKAG
jgi:Kef-type K+ transport system membrane component KefB